MSSFAWFNICVFGSASELVLEAAVSLCQRKLPNNVSLKIRDLGSLHFNVGTEYLPSLKLVYPCCCATHITMKGRLLFSFFLNLKPAINLCSLCYHNIFLRCDY